MTLNKGKDFTEDTLELIVRGPPGSFSVIEGAEYEFWRRGAKTFLTEELVGFASLCSDFVWMRMFCLATAETETILETNGLEL